MNRDPNNKETLRAMANFHREEKDYPEAIAVLKKIAGKNPDILAELGYTYELAQKFSDAADAYAQAADLSPKQIAYQIDAAQSYVHIGNYPRAQAYLHRLRVGGPHTQGEGAGNDEGKQQARSPALLTLAIRQTEHSHGPRPNPAKPYPVAKST